MNSLFDVDGYKAIIQYDAEIAMFRGEFVGLNGGADFYATSVEGLLSEARISLGVFLDMCAEKGVSPEKPYSGKFNIRLEPDLHKSAAMAAAASNKSLNEWVTEAIKSAANA